MKFEVIFYETPDGKTPVLLEPFIFSMQEARLYSQTVL